MFDPAITDSANLFVIIAVALIAFGAAVMAVDVYKNTSAKNNDADKK